MEYSNWANTYSLDYTRPDGKVKDRDYFLRMVQHVFSQLVNGTGAFTFSRHTNGAARRTTKELRNYARALQSTEKYLAQLGYDDREIRKFTQNNISHQPYAIFPKTRNIILSKFSDLNISPMPEALDSGAQYEKLVAKNKLKFVTNPLTKRNVPESMLPSDLGFITTSQDVEFIYEIGGIQLPVELAMQKALKYTTGDTDFEIVDKLAIEDIVDIGGAAIDKVNLNGECKIRYVDFGRVISKPSIYPDLRDSDVRGYTTIRKVSDIMMEDEEEVRANWNFLEKLYRGDYSGFDNGVFRDQYLGYREDYASKGDPVQGIGDFGALTVKLYWLDVDTQYFVSGSHASGHRQFESVPADFTLSKRAQRAGKTIEKYVIQNMYVANWVVGTDIVFAYGKVDQVVRQGFSGAKKLIWPMVIISAQEPSIVEKVVPHIDDIQLAMMKRRQLKAKIAPGLDMTVYKNRIRSSVKMGTEDLDLKKILKLYQREGILFLEENDDYSLPGEDLTRNKPPIEFNRTTAFEKLRSLDESILVDTDRIRQVTGINPVVDGTATKGDILKSVAQSMQTSANNALRPWLELYITFRKNIYNMLCWSYLQSIAVNPDQFEYSPLASAFWPLRGFGVNLLKYNLEIRVEIVDNAYIQFLMQDLFNKKDMLPVEGYLAIHNAIKEKEIRKAEFLLMKFSRKAQELEAQRQQAFAQAQAQAQGEAAKAVEQTKLQAHQMKINAEQQKEMLGSQLQEAKAKQDHTREIEKILVSEEAKAEGNKQVVRENKSNTVFNKNDQ